MVGKRGSLADRLWAKVDKTETCWLWRGSRNRLGYGRICEGGPSRRILFAYRVAYELERGPIPPGLSLDHLCRVPACVNPAHLEAVTHRENVMRGQNPSIRVYHTDICRRGHDYAVVGFVARSRVRTCRQCKRDSDRAWARANPERISAYKAKRRNSHG